MNAGQTAGRFGLRKLQRVPRRYRNLEERFVGGNRVLLLRDGVEAFPAMLEAIREAESQVLLEMYWLDSDRTGRTFAQALLDAAARGVEVAVMYDSLGSWEADETMFEALAAGGVKLVEYNPLLPWKKRFRIGRLTLRDHRKLLVIDGRTGFTGGINLADAWASVDEEGKGWRDDMIRLQGPAVAGLVDMFRVTWSAEGGEPLVRLSGDAGGHAGSHDVRVLGENFVKSRREIVSAYLYNIYRAQRSVYITNAYFVPDPSVVRALKRAADRGVDVRVLLPAESDVEIVRHASRAVWGTLLRHGVRIFEWTKSILHCKTAVIDGSWSTIGTFNLDYRSVFWNLEVNVSVRDPAFGEVVEKSFLRDLEHSREVDYHNFRFRSLGDRLLERVLYSFRRLL
jgi:cardiolipin synthase